MSDVQDINVATGRKASPSEHVGNTTIDKVKESYADRKKKKRKLMKHMETNPKDIFFKNFCWGNNPQSSSQIMHMESQISEGIAIINPAIDSQQLSNEFNNVKQMEMTSNCENNKENFPKSDLHNNHVSEAGISRIDNEDHEFRVDTETNDKNNERNFPQSSTGRDVSKNHQNISNDYQDDVNSESDESNVDITDESSDTLNEANDGNNDEENDKDHDEDDSEGCDGNNEESRNVAFCIDALNDKMSRVMKFKKSITTLAMILLVLALSVRSKLTYTTTILIFKILNAVCEVKNLPTTIKSLWAVLTRNDDVATARHYYCQYCYTYYNTYNKPPKKCKKTNCPSQKCKKKTIASYFIHLNIKSQLEQLFSNAAVTSCLEYRFTREKQKEDSIEDIYDGTKYRQMSQPDGFLSSKYNFTFALFTDGCKVSNSSNVSAWPIMLTINEFSPHARKKYIILAGIWVDKKHPDLQRILLPIINELNFLYETGMTWYHPIEQRKITSRFLTVICILDSAARPDILNMTKYNGYYGCTFCYNKGEHLGEEGRGSMVYPNETVPSDCRTDEEMRKHMEKADKEGKKFHGIKGIATIACLENFDLSCGVPVDSMHNVYLGVVKFHFEYCLQVASDWNVGTPNNKYILNEMLMSIRPPSKISRKPQLLEEWTQWKASQWRNWIEWYALVLLDGIISIKHHKHLRLLCRAVYTLNKSSISTREMAQARTWLQEYVINFEKLYGKDMMRYNVHLLTHLTDSVEHWGPFWTHSAFPYESYNKKIVDKVTSANARPLQIATRFLLERFIENSFNNDDIPQEVKILIHSTLTNGLKTKKTYPANSHQSVSLQFKFLKRTNRQETKDNEIQALSRAGYKTPKEMNRYQRVTINGTIKYAAQENKDQETRHCDRFIYCDTIGGYGEITEIVQILYANDDADDHESSMMVNGMFVNQLPTFGNAFDTEHIQYVKKSDKTLFLAINEKNVLAMITPAIVIRTLNDGTLIISKLSNMWETD